MNYSALQNGRRTESPKRHAGWTELVNDEASDKTATWSQVWSQNGAIPGISVLPML
jgi:hypothetical protein